MKKFYISRNGFYLALRHSVEEDDYWQPEEITRVTSMSATWIKDYSEAKSFDTKTEAETYILRHRYKDCEVVKR